MRYFIIAGEVSGHTYAEQLMRALSQTDPLAEFNYRGPDKNVAVTGFMEAASHSLRFCKALTQCKKI